MINLSANSYGLCDFNSIQNQIALADELITKYDLCPNGYDLPIIPADFSCKLEPYEVLLLVAFFPKKGVLTAFENTVRSLLKVIGDDYITDSTSTAIGFSCIQPLHNDLTLQEKMIIDEGKPIFRVVVYSYMANYVPLHKEASVHDIRNRSAQNKLSSLEVFSAMAFLGSGYRKSLGVDLPKLVIPGCKVFAGGVSSQNSRWNNALSINFGFKKGMKIAGEKVKRPSIILNRILLNVKISNCTFPTIRELKIK